MFNDHKAGQFVTVANTNNLGQMTMSGNHQFDNYVNNGQANAIARTFNPDGTPVQLMQLEEIDLEDLAAFNNVQQNAQMGFTGTHAVKNLNTGAKSVTNFNDHKGGQFSTVANTNNMGQMNISGNHQFDNFVNNGVANALPRTFNPDGSPAQLMELDEEYDLEDLASFNNYSNADGA